MIRTLIAVEGSHMCVQIIEVASALLAGRSSDVTLLHVAPRLIADEKASDDALVLESFLDADRCESVMAPLAARLHEGLERCCQLPNYEPRVVPRHLMHRTDLSEVIARCDLAQHRRSALVLLDQYARALRQQGIDAASMTRDSAIGDPASVILATAAHFDVHLIMVGRPSSAIGPWATEGAVAAKVSAQASCPVLVVPTVDDLAPADVGTTTFPPFSLD